MVTGIEAVGLTLAIFPLLVNQIDAYARSIERIRLWRRWSSELKQYSIKLGCQHAIFLNTLEDVLQDVVDKNEEVADLISCLHGDRWQSRILQERLCTKLGRSYKPFLGMMNRISELLRRASSRISIDSTDEFIAKVGCDNIIYVAIKLTSRQQSNISYYRIIKSIFSVPIYDDIMREVDDANSILKALIGPPSHQIEMLSSQRPRYVFQNSRVMQQHFMDLFKQVAGSRRWTCVCKGHHSAHLQLEMNSLKEEKIHRLSKGENKVHIVFSSTTPENFTGNLKWSEVMCELRRLHGKPRGSPIDDFCSSLSISRGSGEGQTIIGHLDSDSDPDFHYTVLPVNCLHKMSNRRSLKQIPSHLSRYERLRIASGLACAFIQLSGNWLRCKWDSSDISIIFDTEEKDRLLDVLIFSSHVSNSLASDELPPTMRVSNSRKNTLFPLGLILAELSLGESLRELCNFEKGEESVDIEAALRVIDTVSGESGSNYAMAVQYCILTANQGMTTSEEVFQKRVFDAVVSPLLDDLAYFEGVSV